MILVDTSVWIDHLRDGDARLAGALRHEQVAVHAFVIGELACGNLRNREEILEALFDLPAVDVADDRDVFELIETSQLWGHGLGWVDVHLLVAAHQADLALWTRDKALLKAAAALGLTQT